VILLWSSNKHTHLCAGVLQLSATFTDTGSDLCKAKVQTSATANVNEAHELCPPAHTHTHTHTHTRTHARTHARRDRQTHARTRTHLCSYLEMSSEGSCTMALEALPALRASSTSSIGTSSCSTTASLSLLALIALLTNKAQNCRQYSTKPCDLGCTVWSAEGSMRRVGGTREEP